MLMDRLRILAVAERIDRKHELWGQPEVRMHNIGDSFSWPPTHPPERLSKRVREGDFQSEVGDGIPTADEFAKESVELEGKRRLRWIQGQTWRGDARSKPARALAPQGPSVLADHIGPAAESLGAPFPDYQFDFSGGPVDLYVQVALSGAFSCCHRTGRTPVGVGTRSF